MSALTVLFLGGSGVISSACSWLAVERGVQLHVLNRGKTSARPLPAEVRLSCLYSCDDAVVHWRSCQDPDPRTTLCEVRGSHTDLAWNAAVYRHLGRLLAT